MHPGGLSSSSHVGAPSSSGSGLVGSGVVTGPTHSSVCPGSHGGKVVDGASPGTQLGRVPVVPGGHVFSTLSCDTGEDAAGSLKGSRPVAGCAAGAGMGSDCSAEAGAIIGLTGADGSGIREETGPD